MGMKMQARSWAARLAIGSLLLGTSGCTSSNTGETGQVRIDGSSTVYPISEAVAEEFTESHGTIRVTVGFSGTGGGFKKLIQGELDICDASREIKESEEQLLADAGIEYVQLEVAYDGLTVVGNPGNDWVDCLTVAQLKEIWRPESPIKRWSDLNPDWPEEEIKLYGPGTDSGTFDYFTKAICGEEKASRADYTASEDDNMLVRGITEDKYALGYFGYAYYEENKSKLKLMGVDNGAGCVTPSLQTVTDGTYAPLSRPLFIYVTKSSFEREDVRTFIDFYLEHSASLATEVGYVPISAEAAAQNRAALDALSGAAG